MLRTIVAATLLLLAALATLPPLAAADPGCTGADLGPAGSAGACVEGGYVLVYRCTRINCQAVRVPVPPVTG